jgi:methyl-accepting chemotaxis protein
MSAEEQILPIGAEQPAAAPAGEGQRKPWAGIWFGWWVAACLVVLALNTQHQLQAQQRILEGSRKLQDKVGEAAAVSVATNQQLGKVAELDRATSALAVKLERLGAVNTALKGELASLEATAGQLQDSVAHLDAQALQSHQQLAQIAAQSDQLYATLQRSRRSAEQVAGYLNGMVDLQERVNAELVEMNAKTKALERFLGGP